MENISKALIITGTVIITVLLMTLLWNLYTNFQQINKIDDEAKKFEQDIEYNKKFQAFNRKKVKGVEILSLYNLVEDYNLREVTQADVSGINVTIEITERTKYFEKKIYTVKEIKNKYDSIEQKISELLKTKYLVIRTIDYFAELTEDELNKIKQQYPELNGNDFDNKIKEFKEYKSEQELFKQKNFKCVNIEYQNQRIIKMEFKEQ